MRSTSFALVIGLTLAVACATHSKSPVATVAPAAASDTIGKFVWHDLISDDVPAARRFYGELLGWQFTDVARRGRPYVMARLHGQPVGGMVAVEPVSDREVSQWIGFESVTSVDDAVATFEKSGGHTLVAPVNVESIGRAALVTDPQGAPVGLLRLAGADPPDLPSPVEGRFFWMEYLARDPSAAAAFYAGTFGYTREVTDRLASTEYVVLRRGRPRGGILQAPRPDMRPAWLPYILVSDPAPLVARVRALGGTVLLEPRADVRKSSLAVVTDPSGAMFALQKYPF